MGRCRKCNRKISLEGSALCLEHLGNLKDELVRRSIDIPKPTLFSKAKFWIFDTFIAKPIHKLFRRW